MKRKDGLLKFCGEVMWLTQIIGRADNMYVGKVNGEWKYLSRQYLLWWLRDLLEIINVTNTFWEKLAFTQLYDFTKITDSLSTKKFPIHFLSYNLCENCVPLVKGLNNFKKHFTNWLPKIPYDILERYSYADVQRRLQARN